MKSKRFNLRIYLSLIRMTLRSMMQYRADFWMSLVGVVILNSANLVQLGVLSWRFETIGNWGVGDLMVLYGLCMICWSLYSIFFKNLSNLQTEIVTGAFDKYLLRPVSPFVQLVGGEIRYTGLCDTIMGALLVASGLAALGLRWTPIDFLWLFVFIVSGGVIIVCIQFIVACVAFWSTKASALRSIVTHIYLLIQKYPITIFGTAFRVLVTAVLPVAFLNFYPAAMLLRKPDAPQWLCMLSPAVALLLVFLSGRMWKRGLRRYNSSGS